MPPIPLPQNGLVQVRIVGRMDGQETNNVLHFTAASAIDDIDLRIIQVLANCFITNLLPVLSSSWTLEAMRWKIVAPALGVEQISVPLGAGAGGGSAVALPSFASAVLSIRTSLGGRSRRGRMYIPGIPEGQTTNSSFDSALPLWAGLIAFAACVAGAFIPGDPPGSNAPAFGIYSRKLGGATFPYNPVGFATMAAINPVSIIGTTRSRKVGRGS